uniref:Ion transport domain-containing protein n=1 Tax=Octactis speculum TaxID=3111310 RepID=A0A7S2FHT8_9STRA
MLGMEFFANKMRFDPANQAIEGDEDFYKVISDAKGSFTNGGFEIHSSSDFWQNSDDCRPRGHFDTLWWGFVTIFQILSGENWNSVMYDGWRATNVSWCPIYFVLLLVLGNFIVVNLFLAIMLSNLSDLSEPSDNEDQDEEEKLEARKRADEDVPTSTELKEWNAGCYSFEEASALSLTHVTAKHGRSGNWRSRLATSASMASQKKVVSAFTGYAKYFDPEVLRDMKRRKENLVNSSTDKELIEASVFPLDPRPSLWILGPDNIVRIACALIVEHPTFDKAVLLLILFSSFMLAIDSPLLDPESTVVKCITVIDVIMTTFFYMEMILKIFAMNFYTYIVNPWNILDFIVVWASGVSLGVKNNNIKALKAIRVLRAFRPLRVINRQPGLKIIVNALFSAIPETLNVLMVFGMIILVFAIFGVQNYKGQLRSCGGSHFDNVIYPDVSIAKRIDGPFRLIQYPEKWNKMSFAEKNYFGPDSAYFSSSKQNAQDFLDSDGWDEDDNWPLCNEWPDKKILPTGRQICECLGGEWTPMVDQSFDNTGLALMALFELATTEGWVDVMYAAVDSRGIDQQPIRDTDPYMAVIYFILFIFVSNFLFLSLFVGVVIDNFNAMREKQEGGNLFLTETQMQWVQTQEMLIKINPQKNITPPGYWFGDWCLRVSSNDKFEIMITVAILVNMFVMMGQYFGEPRAWTETQHYINYFFTFLFTIEAVLKLFGQRCMYFTDNWNRFDFIIVILSLFGVVMDMSNSSVNFPKTGVARTFRVARALRAFRLVQGSSDMKKIFDTLMLTLPGLINVGSLLLLLFYIFAVLGVQLFSTVALNGANDEHTNLRYFGRAFFVLLRFSTGENWNGFMHAVAEDTDECWADPEYDSKYCGYFNSQDCEALNGCGNYAIVPYMYIFTCIIAFVFVNLFVGVILEGFEMCDEDDKLLTDLDFDWFTTSWQHFDPNASCYISISELEDFALRLICNGQERNHAFLRLRDYWDLDENQSSHSVTSSAKLREFRQYIKIFETHSVHFKHVLMAFGKEIVKAKLADDDAEDDIEDIPKVTQQKVLKNFSTQHGYYMKGLDHRALLFDGGDHYTVRHHCAAQILHRAFSKYRTRVLLERFVQDKLQRGLLAKESSGVWEHAPNAVRCMPANRRDQKSYSQQSPLVDNGKMKNTGSLKQLDGPMEKSDLKGSDTDVNEEIDDDGHDDSLL